MPERPEPQQQSSPDAIIGKMDTYRRYDEYVRAEEPPLPGDERMSWQEVIDHRWGEEQFLNS